MKLAPVLLLFAIGAQASWFGSDTPSPAYTSWDSQQLAAWLKAHDVPLPSSVDPPTHKYLQELVKKHWSTAQNTASDAYDSASEYSKDAYDSASQYGQDAYDSAQNVMQAGKEKTQFAFDRAVEGWDDSALRQFLLDRGVVEPKGPREQLEKLAKEKYREYMRSMGSASAYVAQATQDVGRKVSEERDWVYSTWDDSQLRSFLVDKGILKSKQEMTRDEMIKKIQEYYRSAVDPIYESWSDSYLNEWLFSHNIPPFSRDPPSRATLLERMKAYYYDVTQRVWNTWTDSQTRDWLISHNIIKSDAQISREKLQRLVADNYLSARDTLYAAWRDADLRAWLVEHGVVTQETADKMTREQLEKKMSERYDAAAAKTEDYLVWPDARLRAFLREHGVSEDALPTSRPGLLQETRIRWVQTQHSADALYQRILSTLSEGKHIAEEKLYQILAILSGRSADAAEYTNEKAGDAKAYAGEKAGDAKAYAGEKVRDAEAAAARAKNEL